MGDIFDEVKAMEEAESASATETQDSPGDANFNATELEDIMAEIDNLEKDFATTEVTPTPTPVEVKAEVKQVEMPVQQMQMAEPVKKEESKVLSFEKKSIPALDTKSNVTLAATGNMNLNLTFKIGEEDATLVIDQEKGLLVNFSGVELSLHADKGCTVEMANGILFSVPVQTTSSKKKAA